MKQKLLLTQSLRAALMLLAVVLTWGSARASHTINVMQNSAVAGGVYIYAWDQDDKPLTDAWPGTRLTATTTVQGVTWYTMTFTGATTVKFKLNLGGTTTEADASATQEITAALPENLGAGHFYYEYDPQKYQAGVTTFDKFDNLTDIYDLPAGVTYSTSDNCVYFLNVKGWTNVYCHFWRVSDNAGTSWPGVLMTKVGTNSNGWDIYKWTDPNPSGAVDKKFIIHDNQANTDEHRSPEFVYTHNDVISGYNYTKLCNVSSERDGTVIYNTPNYFSDANMRAALEDALGVPASATNVTDAAHAIAAKSVKVLDISNHNVGGTTGFTHFTELEELYAGNNNITYADLQSNTKLRILDLHKNENLLGFGTGDPGSGNPIVRLPSGCLEYLNMSNTRLRNYAAKAFANKVASTLETFIARDVFYTTDAAKLVYNNIPSIATLTKLKYLDVSGCDGTPVTIISTSLANVKSTLEYLDVSNQNMSSSGAAQTISGFTALETLKFANQPSWANTMTITGCTSLKEVDLSGNTHMKAISITGSPLDSVVVTGNSNVPSITINNCGLTDLSAIKGLGTLAALTEINVNNNSITSIDAVGALDSYNKLDILRMTNQSVPANSTLTYTGHTVPARINLSESPNFTAIDLSDNALKTVFAKDITALETLDVSGNLLNTTAANYNTNNFTSTTNLCLYLGGCTALETLDASDNNIVTFGKNSALQGCTSLKTLNLANNGIFSITTATSNSCLQDLTGLETVNLSNNSKNSSGHLHLVETSGLANLTTVNLSNNFNDATKKEDQSYKVTISGSPALQTINVTGETWLNEIDLSDNGLTNNLVPTITGWTFANATLKYNNNSFSQIPAVSSNVGYLYLQENAFAQDLTLNGDAISLKGIALNNKSSVAPIKKFTASVAQTTPDQWAIDYSLTPPAIVQTNTAAADGSNTVLEAINLDGNNALDSVKVNGFKAITKLASATDMTTDAGKGIYVKGLSSLKKLDISGNRIVLIGQDGSLSGLTGLEQLDASHNVIRTLANRTARGTSGNANYRAAYGNGKYTAATCPNIEDLTGLKRLNLSYNHLCDSIHLETNHALEWLDVSHNRFINDRTDAVDVGQLYYLDSKDGVIKQWKETAWKVRRDAFTGDANDTIGLRMLDLYRQTNLRYLNISETYIENTATSRIYVANRQGPLTLTTSTQADHEGHTVGRWGVPRFVLINHCSMLDTLICNYNGMKSLGIGSTPQASSSSNGGQITGCPNLKYLEAKEMRGQDPAIMQGELRVSARNPLMEHYDVSGSNFDYIGLADGATGEHLRYINVSGNYQSQNTYTDNGNGTWTTTSTVNGKYFTVHGNPYQLNLSALPVLDSLVSVNTPHLQVMSAHNMPEFNYMEITQDPANNDLRELYLHHNATMNDVIGLETLNHLEVYQINDSHFTGALEMPTAATATLRDLRVSNEALSYAASRNNLTSVPLGSFNALERVDVQNNPAIAALDINATSAATLAHLDFANCHLDNDGFTGSGVDELTALEYLDCSNDDANVPNGTAGNWLTDLDLTAASGLTTLKAANNELYKLAVSPSQTMAVLDFHNNHVNGIDLTGVTVTNYNCANNGRKVKANAKAMAGGKTLYYFQLDATAAGDTKGGNFVGDEQSDMYIHNGSRTLGSDGFDATKASFASTVTHTSSSGAPRLKDAATAADLDPSKIYGTIAVLEPAASGDSRASYGYNEGNANLTTEFYLDWDASDAIVTAIDDINGNVGEVSLRPGVGGMEVIGPAGQTFGVYDMAGRLVQQVTTDQTGRATIDGLTPGIYVVAGEKAQVR